jgi:hypothetical protein
MPGSTLYAIYTRAQHASPVLAGALPGFRVDQLSRGPADDILAIKFVYFWAR